MSKQKVGVLAIQGGYQRHYAILNRLADASIVKTEFDLKGIDKLVLPGGESTTFLNLLHKHNLWNALAEFCSIKPVFGTCAGSIVLSKGKNYFNSINLEVQRNGYGRQIDSFVSEVETTITDNKIPAIFIRAPKIINIGSGVEILAKYDELPILAKQDNVLVSTFHPELTSDYSIHRYFVSM